MILLVIDMQINRLLEMIYILLHRKSVPARELAEQLGVSRRTIYRDIDILSVAGIPVYTEKGRGGGVHLLPDSVLNRAAFSEKEQNEILTALHGLSSIKRSEADQVLRKLSTIFGKTSTNWLEVDFSDWSYANDYFNDFKIAIIERRIAEFDYYNSNGDKTFRRIEPVQLWFKSHSWYLKGFCLIKQGMRLYKLSRVKNLVVTDEYFSERDLSAAQDDFPPDTKQDLGNVAIRLRISPEMKYRVFDDFGESSIEEQADGSFIVAVSWPVDNWVYGFILSFGEYIEVLEPERIRKIIMNKGKKIYEKYF